MAQAWLLVHSKVRGSWTELQMSIAYFTATTAAFGRELWRLGNDGSVTFWADIRPGSS